MGEKCGLGQGERLGNFGDECDRGEEQDGLALLTGIARALRANRSLWLAKIGILLRLPTDESNCGYRH